MAGFNSDLRHFLQGLAAAPDRRRYLAQMAARFEALRKFDPPAENYNVLRGWSVAQELNVSRLHIKENLGGSPPASFAYPAGRFSTTAARQVRQAGFISARSNDLGINTVKIHPFALKAVGHGPGTSIKDLEEWIDAAVRVGGWLILVFHLIAGRNPAGYPYFCSIDTFCRPI